MASRKPGAGKKKVMVRQAAKSEGIGRLAKPKATARPAAAIEAAAWRGVPALHLSSKSATALKPPNSDPYADLFGLPYAHSLMNANLATIKTVDPAHPNEPAVIKIIDRGVEADVVVTGIAGTRIPSPSSVGYGIPTVSIVQDIRLYRTGDHQECLVQSDIPFPFSASTTQSHAITQCNQAPDLTSAIAGDIVDHVMIGALIAAANAMGQQFGQNRSVITLHDLTFWKFDKEVRTKVGNEINQALAALKSPIPVQISTGNLMAPFMVLSVPAFDIHKRTIDVQFESIGFSTMLNTVDHRNGQVVLGSALSLQASGHGHIYATGVDLSLDYKFNAGSGLLPLSPKFAPPPKYSSPINDAMIPRLESYIKTFFPSQLDDMLVMLGGLPLKLARQPNPLALPKHRGRLLLEWADLAKRRSTPSRQ